MNSLKFIFTFFLLGIISSNSFAFEQKKPVDDSTLDFIRNSYYASIDNDEELEKLEAFIAKEYSANVSKYPPIILAYYGGVIALKGKHAFWPFDKLNYLNTSMDILELAINKDPDNLEIRFLRFSILDNIPGILGYSEEREEDKNKIVQLLCEKNYAQLKESIQEGIANYMVESGRLKVSQVDLLKKNCPQFTLNK